MKRMRYLIEEGKVDPDCKEFGFPPICGASSEGYNKMIEYLVSIGANINAKDKYDQNALHHAVIYGQLRTMQLLISLGANFNVKNYDAKTPLQLAQEENKKEIVEFLKEVEQK
jgi:ankyrin repeat protein